MCKLSDENSLRVLFSLLQYGKILAIVRGVNAPLITKIVTDLVQEEREIAAGKKKRAQVLTKRYLCINGYFYYTYTISLNVCDSV